MRKQIIPCKGSVSLDVYSTQDHAVTLCLSILDPIYDLRCTGFFPVQYQIALCLTLTRIVDTYSSIAIFIQYCTETRAHEPRISL